MAPVSPPRNDLSSSGAPLELARNEPPRSTPPRRWRLVALMCVASLGLVLVLPLRNPANSAIVRGSAGTPGDTTEEIQASPLTSYVGAEADPSFSPEGTRIAFSWDGPRQDNVDVYVKLVGAGNPVRLTWDPADDYDPAWSPDGRWIAFVRNTGDSERAIVLVPALGGPERTVTRTRAVTNSIHSVYSPAVSWSADGRWLFTLDVDSADMHRYAVYRVALDSGEKTQVTFPDGSFGELAVAVSPDGRTLAYTRGKGFESADLYALGLSDHGSATGGPQVVTSARSIQGIAWTADSREVVFAGDLAGKAGLWRVPAFGSGRARRLNGIGNDSGRLKRMGRYRGMSVSVSRTGGRLAFTQGMFDANIWRVGLGRDKRPAERLISSTKDEMQPAYSPDGRQIAFESDRSGNEEIWVCEANGASPFQVTNFGAGWSGSPRWSPDESTIAFDRLERNTHSVYLVGRQGGKPALLAADAFGPAWSRDGHWVYFISERTDRSEVWKAPVSGGPAVQVTMNGGMAPSESLDGQFVYFSRAAGPSNVALWRTSTAGGVETKVLDQLLFPRAYAVAARGIYFLEGAGRSVVPVGAPAAGIPPLIRFLDTKTKKQTTVGSTHGTNLAGRIAVSPDERWLLYGQEDGTGTDIMIVEKFR